MAEPPPQQVDHHQLRKRAAPAFDDAGSDIRAAVRMAAEALRGLGGWSTDEEVDKAFVEWFTPKRDEMIELIGQFAEVYEDVGDGLRAISQNVATVDWGIADDLKVEDLPIYSWPPKQGS
ncbi:hypothetical protein [Nonomuraea africana]|uniref:WXG100 family type VII secretion target n=1 Tax=Nonomuraea africana TaxID=46171 RepID=A0ABR9KUA2_9ACTN|nr:hypothetical protein [Nonomuraea africana]MBE1565610.1 hypothetical protein [Nonomuraea africana]